jgi:excisionase family DNA binding protein
MNQPVVGKVEAALGDQLYSTEELAEFFHVTEPTVREWLNKGELRGMKFGKDWFVSKRALLDSLSEKEARQNREEDERRREAEVKAQLVHHQSVDPAARWELANCIACGVMPVLSTLPERKDGDVICEACRPHIKEDGFTKVATERKVTMRVNQLNRLAEEEATVGDQQLLEDLRDSGQYVPVPWVVYRCGWCERPQALRRKNLYDPTFLPMCAHGDPYETWYEHDDDAQDFFEKMIRALATLEAEERNLAGGYDPDPDLDAFWLVCGCVICNRPLAVASKTQRLIGDARCRICMRDSRNIGWADRVHAIKREVDRVDWSGRTTRRLTTCQCGSLELREDKVLVLSACEQLDEQNRVDLAKALATKHKLGPALTEALVEATLEPAPYLSGC